MFKVNFDGTKEYDALCTVGTLSIYEQEFKSDMIADVMGKIDLADTGTQIITADFIIAKLEETSEKQLPKTTVALIEKAFPVTINTVIDYTQDNWIKYLQALWAMLKTADYVSKTNNIPSYKQWLFSVGDIDAKELSYLVVGAIQDGLFRYGATSYSK